MTLHFYEKTFNILGCVILNFVSHSGFESGSISGGSGGGGGTTDDVGARRGNNRKRDLSEGILRKIMWTAKVNSEVQAAESQGCWLGSLV